MNDTIYDINKKSVFIITFLTKILNLFDKSYNFLVKLREMRYNNYVVPKGQAPTKNKRIK